MVYLFGFFGSSFFLVYMYISMSNMIIIMIIANIAKTCSILRFSVEGSRVADGDPVGVIVGVGVGVRVGVGVGVAVDVITVAKESRVAWSMGSDILGSLSVGG